MKYKLSGRFMRNGLGYISAVYVQFVNFWLVAIYMFGNVWYLYVVLPFVFFFFWVGNAHHIQNVWFHLPATWDNVQRGIDRDTSYQEVWNWNGFGQQTLGLLGWVRFSFILMLRCWCEVSWWQDPSSCFHGKFSTSYRVDSFNSAWNTRACAHILLQKVNHLGKLLNFCPNF